MGTPDGKVAIVAEELAAETGRRVGCNTDVYDASKWGINGLTPIQLPPRREELPSRHP